MSAVDTGSPDKKAREGQDTASPQGDRINDDHRTKPGHDNIAAAGAQAYAPGALPDIRANRTQDQTRALGLPEVSIDFSKDKAKDGDKTREGEKTQYTNPNVSPEAQELVRQAEKTIMRPGYPNAAKEFEQFKADVELFERQAKANNLSDQEVRDTYKGIDKLLKSADGAHPGLTRDGMQSERQRIRVAEQLMNMTARPEDRSQGSYDTCAMATVEGMLLTGKGSHPAKVTQMVSDVALTGKTNVGGTEVKLDRQSMQSFGEHAQNREYGADSQRLAENIFRLTAANTYYGIMKEEGKAEGQLQYVSRPDGNRLIYKRDHTLPDKPELAALNKPEGRVSDPGDASTMVAESRILNKITGDDYKSRVLVNTNVEKTDPAWTTGYKSQAELDDVLKKTGEDGKFPVALGVYTGNELFSDGKNPFSAMDKIKNQNELEKRFKDMYEDGHSLMLTGRNTDFGSPRYGIKNTWGESSNISGSAADVFQSTEPVRPTKLADFIDSWHQDHSGDKSKEHTEKFAGSLFFTAAYIEMQRKNSPAGGSQAMQRDYEEATRHLATMYKTVPEKTRRELEQTVDKLAEQTKDADERQTLMRILLSLQQ